MLDSRRFFSGVEETRTTGFAVCDGLDLGWVRINYGLSGGNSAAGPQRWDRETR
jgi:hypothetical protein